MQFDIRSLQATYAAGTLRPADVIAEVYGRIRQHGERPVWITLAPEADALASANALPNDSKSLPLWGIPFAVKDNIDVAGLPTTAACPDFARVPQESAAVVEKLRNAGAILIGKTNMDQFATGLVGTRSPYGACSSVFDERYISGGSSSGSSIAVAQQLVSFALGTDTAGSGRVPAAFNNLVGVKPTRGIVSTRGVLPACRTLDCVSIFAASCEDAALVLDAVKGFDAADPYSRETQQSPLFIGSSFRFGVPKQLEFFGDEAARTMYDAAVERMEATGGERVEIDFSVFHEAASLLYSGPWVAERLAAVQEFVASHAESLHPVFRQIIAGADKYSAVDAFRAMYRLQELKQKAEVQWALMDVLLVPTTGTIYTHEQVTAEPIALNTNLGYYTNFVNLMDLAAVAVPAGFRENGLPFGVQLISRSFTDDALLSLGSRFMRGRAIEQRGFIPLAVVGAHLSGQPLNHQLTSRGAKLLRATRTAADYRLYALSNTAPPKPGLIREPGFAGTGIEVEVWAMPAAELGTFVQGVPSPLGIGKCVLEDGSEVVSFICEPWAVADAKEITHFGGWRAYRAEMAGR